MHFNKGDLKLILVKKLKAKIDPEIAHNLAIKSFKCNIETIFFNHLY